MASFPFHPPGPLSFHVCSTSLISQPSKTSRDHSLRVERPVFPRSLHLSAAGCRGMERGMGRAPPHLPGQCPCRMSSRCPDEQYSGHPLLTAMCRRPLFHCCAQMCPPGWEEVTRAVLWLPSFPHFIFITAPPEILEKRKLKAENDSHKVL